MSFLFASLYFPAAHFRVKIKWRGCAGVLHRSLLLLNAPCNCFYFLMLVFYFSWYFFHIFLVSFNVTGMCRCPPPSPKMHLTKFFLLKLFDFFLDFLIFFLHIFLISFMWQGREDPTCCWDGPRKVSAALDFLSPENAVLLFGTDAIV